MEKMIILGTGIAGCTAAIYAARADLFPIVISGEQDGGQLTLTTSIENFPGFPQGIGGRLLVLNARKQAEKFGARFKMDIATGFEQVEGSYKISLISGEKVQAKTVVIATGASARWLGIPSEEKYKGRGVTVCATCDGVFFKDKEVVVIGGGDSAVEEALFLTKFAIKVTLVHRRDKLRASTFMQEKAKKNPKIKFVFDSAVEEILGDSIKVSGVKLKNIKSGKMSKFKCDGVFLAVGHVPNTKIFEDKLELDEKGYLVADQWNHTNLPGVFAAGDVADARFRQAITAAGSGCKAAMEAEKYLLNEKNSIIHK